VESGFKLADGLIHQNHGRAIIHAENTAKPVIEADDIA
jgi:hypothetical protein